ATTARMMQYDARRKSLLITYLLWFFLPTLGVHRMYLGKWISGFFMLALTLIGGALTFILVGYLPLALVGLWWLLDAILNYINVEQHNADLAYRLS
ncbi:MAG: TM2 domain-containing protein, partial [Pseudomonadota bacterium]